MVAEPETEPDAYVALTLYVPVIQLPVPPVTNPWEYEPSLVLTDPSPERTVAPEGFLTVMTTKDELVGVGETFPNTVRDCAPK